MFTNCYWNVWFFFLSLFFIREKFRQKVDPNKWWVYSFSQWKYWNTFTCASGFKFSSFVDDFLKSEFLKFSNFPVNFWLKLSLNIKALIVRVKNLLLFLPVKIAFWCWVWKYEKTEKTWELKKLKLETLDVISIFISLVHWIIMWSGI